MLDKPVKTADYQDAQMWTSSADISPLWSNIDPNTGADLGPAPQAPAIAFIDSGIDASDTADFGNRVIQSVQFCSLCKTTGNASNAPGQQGTAGNSGNAPGHGYDGEGHGTMVAGIAAGSGADYPGVAQNAPIVNVRVANRDGESMESDVIAACDWILANKDTYGIKVVNISMAGTSPATFQNDPLDQAVQRLWFSGVTVVAAAGNFGTGSAVDMSPAPGNDPFIITVGALDQNQSADPSDDTVAPWSAYGYTADGFSKPDISAPGRYMIMPVPMGTTIPTAVPDRVVAPGYMWMSGTSFAAPVVAGAAAQILARHPDWTPDQVKGALMLTAGYRSAVPTGRRRASARSMRPQRPASTSPRRTRTRTSTRTCRRIRRRASRCSTRRPGRARCPRTRRGARRRGARLPGRVLPGRVRPGRARRGARPRGPQARIRR